MPLTASFSSSSTASGSLTAVGAGAEGAASLGTQATADISSPTAHAPELVREIRAIGERIATVERNSVEVRFDINENERLSVRVEYREGTLHTTFRTDSPELRDVIAQEWTAQAAGENRAYRVADPVFSAGSSGQQNLSSRDGGENRQHPLMHPATAFAAASGSRSTFSTSATVPAVAVTRRPETSLHLHTFA